MKAMKSMKKRAMKVSKIARGKRAKSAVFAGRKEKTYTGLKKVDLIKNKNGRVVSKKQSVNAKKNFAKRIGKWSSAVTKARKQLGCKGFVAINGKTAEGQKLYKLAKSLYK